MRFRDLLKVTNPKTYCVVTVDGEQFNDKAYRFAMHHENILDYMVVSVSADLDYEAEVMGVHICVLSVRLEKEEGGNNE